MNDRAENAPQQLVLPGALAPGDTPPAAPLRLPSIVRDLIERVTPDCRPSEARERVAEWLTSRHAVLGFRPETVYRRFAFELTRVRYDLVPVCVERFVPRGVERGLAPKPVRMARDQRLIDPLLVLDQARGKDAGDARTRFEAERDLALAYLSLWLVTDAELTGEKDRLRWRQERKTAKDRNMFLAHLRREGVLTGQTRTVRPIVTFDERPPHRCTSITLPGEGTFVAGSAGSNIHHRLTPVDLVRLDVPGGPLPALFLPRRKGILQTIAKMLLARLDTPLNVPDRRGVRFAYRNEEELRAGSEFVGKICLGLVRKTHLVHEAAPVNPYASPDLLIVKDSAAFHDRTIEVQHLLARQHMDVQLSQGPEHYLLYHRRQYTAPDGLLPELFPERLYGIDWTAIHVQRQMDEHIRSTLAQ